GVSFEAGFGRCSACGVGGEPPRITDIRNVWRAEYLLSEMSVRPALTCGPCFFQNHDSARRQSPSERSGDCMPNILKVLLDFQQRTLVDAAVSSNYPVSPLFISLSTIPFPRERTRLLGRNTCRPIN